MDVHLWQGRWTDMSKPIDGWLGACIVVTMNSKRVVVWVGYLALLVACGPPAAPSPPAAPAASASPAASAPSESYSIPGFTPEQSQKLRKAESFARAMNDPDGALSRLIAAIPTEAWDHKSDPTDQRNESSKAIFGRCSASFPAAITYQAWKPFWRRSRAIAEDSDGGIVKLNTRKIDGLDAEEYAGTIWHEIAHKAGYRHDGNKRRGNECTVPHVLGDATVAVAEKGAGGPWGELPEDVCPALQMALSKQPQ